MKGDAADAASPGSIEGRICDPSGATWLADAVAYTHLFTEDGKLYDTRTAYSDRNGYWLLEELPAYQTYTVYVQYGTEVLEEHSEWIGDGDEITLTEPDCFDPLEQEVAVIVGDYDDFQLVLSNMGFANYTLVDGLVETDISDFLTDLESMLDYDIIFFNGGHVEEGILYEADEEDPTGIPEEIVNNVVRYAQEGGSLYASDWAYDVVELGWPDRLDFVGDDTVPDDAQQGEYGEVTALVSDDAMADWLDVSTLAIEYDLPVWPPIESADSAVSTHLLGSVEYRNGTETHELTDVPLLVSFGSGEGKVVFSTFRVAKNGSSDMLLILQYMMYNL
ncbi:MAG: carboxypeptidase-like regulatory domain-containing protein [Myxococcota bacterium]|nr:carboxypeptidase-like regulatory domain-containing protein [Myxococcota bacterium]